ncbi:hypothetical protein, partial [Salmonella enterica]|uniref:hypothetical protein n=1 Tax=Salmonella enterica TaxID=28901 RepID=UPI003CF322FE
ALMLGQKGRILHGKRKPMLAFGHRTIFKVSLVYFAQRRRVHRLQRFVFGREGFSLKSGYLHI